MKHATANADPATFEIVKNSFYKIAEEMRVVLAKTAYSPLLKSAGDYSCGVFDARGEMVAFSSSTHRWRSGSETHVGQPA